MSKRWKMVRGLLAVGLLLPLLGYSLHAACPITEEDTPFSVASIARDSNGVVVISFESCGDHLYEIQATTHLGTSTVYSVIATLIGSDGVTTWSDTNTASVSQKFYRVGRLTFAGDADADGLSNLNEFLHGTDLHNADTDGDGAGDGIEVLQGRNPLKGAIADSTGAVNLQVFTPLEP